MPLEGALSAAQEPAHHPARDGPIGASRVQTRDSCGVTDRHPVTFDDCVEVVLEIDALHQYRQLLPRVLRAGSAEQAFLNPLMDAIAVHARALIEFFYGRPSGRSRREDLRASDFVPGWDLEIPTRLAEHLDQLDKHLAHITLRRATDRDEGILIAVGPVADEILEVAAQFAGAVTRWQITPGTWTVAGFVDG